MSVSYINVACQLRFPHTSYTLSSPPCFGAKTLTPKQYQGTEQRHTRSLKSRHPFALATKDLKSNLDQLDIKTADWTEHLWNTEWSNHNTKLHQFISNIDTYSVIRNACPKMLLGPNKSFRHRCWTLPFFASHHYWGMAANAARERGAENQTPELITTDGPLYSLPYGTDGLIRLGDDTNQLAARN